MKKLIVSVIFISAALISDRAFAAEPIRFGVKAGISMQSESLADAVDDITSLSASNRNGYHVGLMSTINLAILRIQPEIVYSSNSFKLSGGSLSDKLRVNTIDVPVLLSSKFLVFNINAGPVFNLMTEASMKNSSDVEISISRPSLGYAIGASLDLWRLNFDVRYHGQFNKSGNHIHDASSAWEFRSNSNNWKISLGYLF